MKTNVSQTSLLAYLSLDDLNMRQRQVFNTIRGLRTACNLDIAEALGIPINSVTPRTVELVSKGLVEESHRDRCRQTGRTVIYWHTISNGGGIT